MQRISKLKWIQTRTQTATNKNHQNMFSQIIALTVKAKLSDAKCRGGREFCFSVWFRIPCCGIRAGLKPMQPMQLHWAPRPWGPHAMVFGKIDHFCQIPLSLENSVETPYKCHFQQRTLSSELANFLTSVSKRAQFSC